MPWPELAALLVFATAMAFTPGPNTTLAAALVAVLVATAGWVATL